MILAAALALTVTIAPPRPTVGDRIAVDFPSAPVVLERSDAFEVVAAQGKRVVVRTFEPKPFKLSGTAGGVAFRDVVVPVHSVLRPKDDLKPAPLAPPRAEPQPLLPLMLIGAAAALCVAVWTWLALRARRASTPVAIEPALPPRQRFRQTVIELRNNAGAPRRWSRLADALRDYLAATSDLSLDLTTTQLLDRTGDPVIARILRQGDLEKFSPWGAMEMNFNDLAERALALAPEEREAVAA